MTNAEKFKKVFGTEVYSGFCPYVETEACIMCVNCDECRHHNWTEQEYAIDKESSMYVEKTFDGIKQAGDFIAEHHISKDDIVEITLHTHDNGVTLTFTTEAELED